MGFICKFCFVVVDESLLLIWAKIKDSGYLEIRESIRLISRFKSFVSRMSWLREWRWRTYANQNSLASLPVFNVELSILVSSESSSVFCRNVVIGDQTATISILIFHQMPFYSLHFCVRPANKLEQIKMVSFQVLLLDNANFESIWWENVWRRLLCCKWICFLSSFYFENCPKITLLYYTLLHHHSNYDNWSFKIEFKRKKKNVGRK